jgi:hypothetical protein
VLDKPFEIDWRDGSPIESGTDLRHTYPAGTQIDDVTVRIPDNPDLPRVRLQPLNEATNDNGNPISKSRIDLENTDFAALDVETFEPSSSNHGKTEGFLSASDMPRVKESFDVTNSHVRLDLASVPRTVRRYGSDQNGRVFGDVMDLPKDLEFIDVEDHNTPCTIRAGGPAGPSTTSIQTLRSRVWVDASPETGLGASTIGGSNAAPNVRFFSGGGVVGDVGNLFRAWRSLERVSCVRASWPGDLRGDNLIPPTIRDLGLQRHNLSYAPTELASWADDVESANFYTTSENHSSALWLTDGTPQMQVLWEELYAIRDVVNPNSSWNLRHERDDNNKELFCTATSPEQVWKMLGLGAFHPVNASGSAPHNVYDAIRSLNLSNKVEASVVSRVDDTTLRLAWDVPDAGSFNRPDYHRTQYRHNTGVVESIIRDAGTNVWRRLFQAGEMMRLISSREDAGLYEIAGHSYDAATREVILSIDSSPATAGASPSLPSTLPDTTCVYGFYFQSQT